MSSVRTRGAGTAAIVQRAPVPELPNLHMLRLPTPWDVGTVQLYLLEGDPLTLVDSGVRTDPSRAALQAAFDELGFGVDELERVILTHYHEDHLGQVQSLRDAGARIEVWAHEAEAPMIEFWTPERDERIDETTALFREYGVERDLLERQAERRRERIRTSEPLSEATAVEHLLRDAERIQFKQFDLEVIHAPGHTAGHILLHEPQSRTLVTGDHIMGGAVPYTDNYVIDGLPAPGDPLSRRPRFKGLPEYMASLDRLRHMDLRTILPAHGGVIRQPAQAIEDARLFYDVRIQRIERGLRNLAAMGQQVTAWELWQALFPKADPESEMRTRMLMVIGALDVLEGQGKCVTSRRDDGVLIHSHRRMT